MKHPRMIPQIDIVPTISKLLGLLVANYDDSDGDDEEDCDIDDDDDDNEDDNDNVVIIIMMIMEMMMMMIFPSNRHPYSVLIPGQDYPRTVCFQSNQLCPSSGLTFRPSVGCTL